MRFLIALAVCITLFSCDSMSQQKAKLKTQQDSVSYAIGADIGRNLKRQEIDLDLNVMLAGMKDAISNGKMQLTDDQMMAVMRTFQEQMMTKMQAKRAKEGEENLAQGKKFCEENAKKEGVKTTASGLQYKVISSGASNGKSPDENSVVKVHYRGTLLNGTEFDSSYQRGTPAEFPVNGVIKGWQEAIKMMKPGDKWQVVIPADIAYGAQGAPPSIPPNATLQFEIELLEIVK